MHKQRVEEIARLVKTGRQQKNFTQQQLAEICGLSLRSIQRIERGEVVPRQYTLNILSEKLEVNLNRGVANEGGHRVFNSSQKIVISIALFLVIILMGTAYSFQSATFPETAFELTLFVAGLTMFFGIVMVRIWK